MEADDGVADEPRLGDVVGVVLTHLLGVDAELHARGDGPVRVQGTDAAGELGAGVGPDVVDELGVAGDLGVVGPGARLAPRRPVVVADGDRDPDGDREVLAVERRGKQPRRPLVPGRADRRAERHELPVALAEVALLEPHADDPVSTE